MEKIMEVLQVRTGLHNEIVNLLSKSFKPMDIVDSALRIYVKRENGKIEKDAINDYLTQDEQLLYHLFKRLVTNIAFDLVNDESLLIFDGDYSKFYTAQGFSGFNGAIKLTKEFTPDTILEIEKAANKCGLKLIN